MIAEGVESLRMPLVLRDGVVAAARGLLGARLISTVDGERVEAVIVETEAYGGADDPASHAAVRAGRTDRNRSMFGPAGHAYVYRSYGVQWCLNIVTGEEGDPQAVLVRGVEPVSGVEVMTRRRGGRLPLAAGPGRVCEALAITGALDGHDLSEPPLRLVADRSVPPERIGVSGRIGVRDAAHWPRRFFIEGSPGVSRVRRSHTRSGG